MDIALPSDVARQVRNFEGVLADLEARVKQVSSQATSSQASPLQKAEHYVTIAQAIQTVFGMYLRLHGTSPEDHPIAKEEDRIARFRRKVSKVNSENILKNTKRGTEVNIQAANRFITAAIPELSVEQKHALRQAGPKRQAEPSASEASNKRVARDTASEFLNQTMQELAGARA